MSRKITLFELNLSDVEFNAPYSGRGTTTDEDEGEAVTIESGGPDGSKLLVVAGLVGLIALAFLVRRKRKSNSLMDEREEPEITSYTD